MRVGVMSDSHGRVELVRKAMAIFREAGVGLIIHCGDVGGLAVLEEMAEEPCRFVWGNTDFPEHGWQARVETMGLPWPDEIPLELTVDGKKIAVCHGHERAFCRVRDLGQYDYVLHGHTHQRDDHYIGKTRVINPGALHRARVHTVAILEPRTNELEFIELE
jgi:hypothetical protein